MLFPNSVFSMRKHAVYVGSSQAFETKQLFIYRVGVEWIENAACILAFGIKRSLLFLFHSLCFPDCSVPVDAPFI